MFFMRKILIVLVCILLVLVGCDIAITDDGFLGTSVNSNVSKSNNVFLSYYNVSPNYIISPQGHKMIIAEAFSEYKYNVKHSGEVVKWDSDIEQLVLRFEDTIPKSYILNWDIEGFTQGSGNFMIHSSFDYFNSSDTFHFEINDYSNDSVKMIGKLFFVKR